MNNQEKLSCAEVRALMDDGAADGRVQEHLTHCPDCRLEARVREAAASLCEDVPPDFSDGVMRLVRAERRRRDLRKKILRYGSAAAAALILIPCAVLIVPRLTRSERALENAAAEYALDGAPEAGLDAALEAELLTNETAAETSAAETMMLMSAAETTAADTAAAETAAAKPKMLMAAPRMLAGTAPAPDAYGGQNGASGNSSSDNASDGNAAQNTASENGIPTEEEARAETDTLRPAPDYVGQSEGMGCAAPKMKQASIPSAVPAAEAVPENASAATRAELGAILTALAGEARAAEWLASYTGTDETLLADAMAALRLSEEDVRLAAAQLGVSLDGLLP